MKSGRSSLWPLLMGAHLAAPAPRPSRPRARERGGYPSKYSFIPVTLWITLPRNVET